MFAFVVPLISPKATNDWGIVSKRCNRTIESILRQSEDNFRVILVCNKAPKKCPSDSRLKIVAESFPTPSNTSEKRRDAWMKIKRGLIEVRKYAPAFVMRVDADDFVSKKIVKYALSNHKEDGWVVKKGYFYKEDKNYVIKKKNFNAYCGTSTIVFAKKKELPKRMESSKNDYMHEILDHQEVKEKMKAYGKRIRTLPFEGSVYNVGHADNILGSSDLVSFSIKDICRPKKLVWKIMGVRPMTKSISQEFGLRPI